MTLTEILCSLILLSLLVMTAGNTIRQSGEYETRIRSELSALRDLRNVQIEMQKLERMEPGSLQIDETSIYEVGQRTASFSNLLRYRYERETESRLTAYDNGEVRISVIPRRRVSADCQYDIVSRVCR